MHGSQLRKLEAELWRAADQLRANSKLTASEYAMPVLGLIFLRHAYNRYLKVKEVVEANLPIHPQRGRRALSKTDFEEQNAMYLHEQAQFEYLVNLPESADIGESIDNAMRLIEDDYDNLKGVLPKNYGIFSKDLLRELLRIFNKEVLQKAEGDLFGKIYEYFLNKFAMSGAQEGGEFFTPMSLVQTIVNIIEPNYGIVFDPACGSAGMFVQTGYFIESEGLRPAEKVTFYGQEKAELNTKLAKMNLAVHGLEGDVKEGNTFYEDKQNLVGKCDFVMANPPFNVDGVDKNKEVIKKDPRLVLDGKVNLPKNDNANYLWIQYFYNYLKPTGRAGFVMASSASDAGHSEKDIREKLVKTGAVDIMMAIGNNFFYTRSLPCTLWFFDRNKESKQDFEDSEVDTINSNRKQQSCPSFNQRNRVLMLDARKIYRKVTSKVNDFSPEQLQNLISIVGLYRGNNQKFVTTVSKYLHTATETAQTCKHEIALLQMKIRQVINTICQCNPQQLASVNSITDLLPEWNELQNQIQDVEALQSNAIKAIQNLNTTATLDQVITHIKALRKPQDKLIKQLTDAVASATKTYQLNKNKEWKALNIKELLDELKDAQLQLGGNPEEEEPGLLHEAEYYYKQAHWLTSRFPDDVYTDVEGLCKVVTQAEIAAKDWSLSPGRYVGVDTSTDKDFDYEERLNEIHIELEGLNEEAINLAKQIQNTIKEII
ncbi:MAG TPA: N-6 DNA methylase [Chitinophagaceae bacterium]|nr:N-6 DNA methylase [Chitinophagaceae bacterium]